MGHTPGAVGYTMSHKESTISWTELKPSNSPLERSSHGVSIVGDTLYMFGGEFSARHPVNNILYALDLDKPGNAWREVRCQEVLLLQDLAMLSPLLETVFTFLVV